MTSKIPGSMPARTLPEIESVVSKIWSDVIGSGSVDRAATFFEAGGSSVQLVRAHGRLQAALSMRFPLTLLFERPRVRELAKDLLAMSEATAPTRGGAAHTADDLARGSTDVAIIGYSARIPGAKTLDAFWQNQLNGDNLIHRFADDALEDAPGSARRSDPNYVPARPVLDDVEMFDAKFFGILPREAEQMDPQARVFLELCVEALDHAAVDPQRAGSGMGVFAGATNNTYLLHNLMQDRAQLEDFTNGFQLENYTTITGNAVDSLATRVAFKLDLRGPALTVGTMCSTSLTAIAQAVTALRAGQCKAALAGGISITFPQRRGYVSQEGGMCSPDGLCRPFDADAGGTVFGHGGGVIVLKRLDAALADGDRIEGVIKGIGLNNDGADKVAYTAPSIRGQSAAIQAAHRDAGIAPETIGYVECHGTATPLGDPIEVRGLTDAFGLSAADTPITLGSIKGNVGHLDAGAGVVGVIRTLQIFRHGVIPPVANYKSPNPRITFDDGPFEIATQAREWSPEGPRRAGVSSFGVGGTNVHVVLEDAPRALHSNAAVDADQIVPLSAKSPEALAKMTADLAATLASDTRPDLADIAHTLQVGRSSHTYRLAVSGSGATAIAATLKAAKPPSAKSADDAQTVFMFPGQGAQYPGMGAALYAAEPDYAQWVDRGCEILQPLLGQDMRPFLTQISPHKDLAATLRETRLTQPALVLNQYALGRLWMSRGVQPAALIGHSVGEYTAAALSGVMSFEDALTAIAARGALMQRQEPGTMLAVRGSLNEITALMPDTVDLAAANTPKMHVIAGPLDAISAAEARLTAAGLQCTALHTSHAFHSRMMDPVVQPLRDEIGKVSLSEGNIPIVSTVTGEWLRSRATDPDYWARQARLPVRFDQALETVSADGAKLFLEVGAGATLATFARQNVPLTSRAGVVQSLPDHRQALSDPASIAAATADLWASGLDLDWSMATRSGTRKVALPGTAFIRKRHFVDPVPYAPPVRTSETQKTTAAALAMPAHQDPITMTDQSEPMNQTTILLDKIVALLSDLAGDDIRADEADTQFLELGFDSLFMGQVAQAIARDFGVQMTFRSLLTDTPTMNTLTAHLLDKMPADMLAGMVEATAEAPQPEAQAPALPAPVASAPVPAPIPQPKTPSALAPLQSAQSLAPEAGAVMQAQMHTMQAIFGEQLRALGNAPSQPIAVQPFVPTAVKPTPPSVAPAVRPAETIDAKTSEPTQAPAKKVPFKVGRAPSVAQADLTATQLQFAKDLADRYSRKFAGSKSHTQDHRAVHADPRTAAGFREEWKEMTFPIVAAKAKGAYIEDVDGNRFVDTVNGFGQTAFGHSPDFVNDAVAKQMDKGFPLGPQSDNAGPAAARFAKMVGHERVTFCNTGSEAVMAAMRLARTVTGRQKVVVFGNDYHGQFDEVLIKARASGSKPGALPIAPGIPRDALGNMVVLPYGADETLDWIAANGKEIAAVLVEPVQSRHPEVQPKAFVQALRRLTREAGSALVMDEVVTGFRAGARGVQGLWDIDADMATYGKVVGGGMPIGALAGTRRFMDALDGGHWSYGDDSIPEVAPTFFAGTFVRHPLTMAAVDAVLEYLEQSGETLWTTAADHTVQLAEDMNAALTARGLPRLVEQFSSWLIINVTRHDPRAALIFPYMRAEGVHVLEGFCCFLTTEHGAAECALILQAFTNALDALQSVGILAPKEGFIPTQLPKTPSVAACLKEVPLTESQREIWMTHQLGDVPASSFNESVTLRIDGALDRAALRESLNTLLERHDALRARFAADGSFFDVESHAEMPLAERDFSAAPAPEDAFQQLLSADAKQPVDIVTALPIRAHLVKLGDASHALVMTAHHIVCDGWSYSILFEELAELYTAATEGRTANLAQAPSFASHSIAVGAKPTSSKTLAFWKAQYQDIPSLPTLPTDRPRPAARSYAGATTVARFDPETVKSIRRAGAKAGCTLFSTLFAGLQITLGRLADTGALVLGVPTGGRDALPDPNLIGHLVDFLPIRSDFEMSDTGAAHLSRVQDAVFAAFEHGDTTLGTLVKELDVPRTLSRLPLTEVQFNLERVPETLALGAATAQVSTNPKAAVNFDLFFNMAEEAAGCVRVDVDYNTALFDEATVQRWVGHLKQVLLGLAEDSNRSIEALPLLDTTSERDIVERWNQAKMEFDCGLRLEDLIAAKVTQTPDALSVSDAGGAWTYADLARESDAIAALIQNTLPASESLRIGVAMPRSRSMMAVLLGVLKAGHAYVPIDIGQPKARQQEILAAAKVAAVIRAKDDTAGAGDTTDILLIDPANADPAGKPVTPKTSAEDPAYLIFTSGSTGTPKGVVIPHRAVVNFLLSMAQKPGLRPDDKVLAMTTISFDIAVLELFLPLITGAHVEICDRTEVLDCFAMVERISKGDVTLVQATPTYWSMMLEAGFTPSPKVRMLVGGEPLPADLAEALCQNGAELWNMYGPTETTIWSSLARVEPGAAITIGEPVANTELHVLDANDQICAPGVVGELNIGGDGLAIGYFERDDLTDRAFQQVLIAGETRRLYRTGDLAIRDAAGHLKVLGRRDGQVKLRGFRIELGEIEVRLRGIDGVAAAAVDVRPGPSGDDQLVAYIASKTGAELDTRGMQDRLADALPDYMVPNAWVQMESLPQTANGKLDRKRLPKPAASAPIPLFQERRAPSSATEKRLVEIWQTVLPGQEPSLDESVFAMGIDSLMIFRLASQMMKAGLKVEARHILEHKTIKALAAYIEAQEGENARETATPSLKDFFRRRPTGT